MGGHARASRALLALLALPWFLALAPAQAADEPRAFFTVQPAVGRTGAAFLADASLSSPSPGERIESYHWRWANGSFEPGNATSSHVFRQAGVFEVALRIRDTAGRESLALQTVYVEGARPLAYFTARTEERDGATVVTVDATFSQPSAGARRIVQYEWRWGDDPEADFRPGNITEEHAYTEAGTYTIELRVTDDEGRSSTMEHPVIVGGTFFGRLARVWGIREAFLQGALVTLELTAISVAGGFALAVFLALGRASRSRALSALATGYIEVIRGTPLLVQILIVWLVLPVVGIRLPIFWAGAVALLANTAAYQAEAIRAGIQGVQTGQMEAALSLGFTHPQAMRHVVLPQAFRTSLPALGNEIVILLKDTSLVSVIGVVELTQVGRIFSARTFLVLETWLGVAAIYLVLTYTLALVLRRLEVRVAIPGLGVGGSRA